MRWFTLLDIFSHIWIYLEIMLGANPKVFKHKEMRNMPIEYFYYQQNPFTSLEVCSLFQLTRNKGKRFDKAQIGTSSTIVKMLSSYLKELKFLEF